MKLFERFQMHLRMSHGSTYGYNIIDEAGAVVGYKSVFVTKNPKKHPARTVYTLGDQEFADDLEGFQKAYEQQLEQARRDAEWNEAGLQTGAKP